MKYLIVDDHALVAGALTLLLEDRDPEADVHTAATADAALELVDREGDADLLILDLSLPGVTGTELMEEIVRRQPDAQNSRCIGPRRPGKHHARAAAGCRRFCA